jgi:hypothetical protein
MIPAKEMSAMCITRATTAILALLSLAACNIDISNQAEAHDEWKKTYTLAAGGTLEILNTNGAIEVDPADGSTVDVVAERLVRAGTDQAAKDALAALEIKETVAPDRVVLDSSTHLSGFFTGSREVRYHVKVPKGTSLRLVATNGSITAHDFGGAFRAETTNGRIKAWGLSAGASVQATNGSVDLDFATIGTDGITCETTNGAVSVTVPHDANGRLTLRVGNGGIDTEGLTLGHLEQARRSLDATLGSGTGSTIRIETTNGGIHVRGK